MSDTLPKLLQEIHSVETASELNSKIPDFESRISAILSSSPDQKNYYINHTGRELYRKLYNFGLDNLISYTFDSGFRPNLPDWTPTEISMNGWYDTSDGATITEASSIVTQINDKSGNNRHLHAGSTSTNNHTLISEGLNGLDVVQLDGDDRYNPLAGQNLSVPDGNLQAIILARVDDVDNFADSVIAAAGVAPNFQLNAASSSEFKAQVNSQAGITTPSTTNFIGSWAIYNAFFDWGNQFIKSYVNGSEEGSSAYSEKLGSSLALRVFTNRANQEMPAGLIAEIVICNDVTSSTRLNIEGYLAHKWGLESQLPSSHPYKKVAPFIFDI